MRSKKINIYLNKKEKGLQCALLMEKSMNNPAGATDPTDRADGDSVRGWVWGLWWNGDTEELVINGGTFLRTPSQRRLSVAKETWAIQTGSVSV